MLPAMAEPTRFLEMLHSTSLHTVVLSTDETVLADKTASTCIMPDFYGLNRYLHVLNPIGSGCTTLLRLHCIYLRNVQVLGDTALHQVTHGGVKDGRNRLGWQNFLHLHHVIYYVLTEHPHISKLIGSGWSTFFSRCTLLHAFVSGCTAFFSGCTAFIWVTYEFLEILHSTSLITVLLKDGQNRFRRQNFLHLQYVWYYGLTHIYMWSSCFRLHRIFIRLYRIYLCGVRNATVMVLFSFVCLLVWSVRFGARLDGQGGRQGLGAFETLTDRTR